VSNFGKNNTFVVYQKAAFLKLEIIIFVSKTNIKQADLVWVESIDMNCCI
jgi:hypothetical protein